MTGYKFTVEIVVMDEEGITSEEELRAGESFAVAEVENSVRDAMDDVFGGTETSVSASVQII